ncbi:hypothetical protein S245_069908, partial [Arachis hypogaea]
EDDPRTAVYMPNAVFRQFELAQAIPSPYHLQESQSLHVKATSLEDLLHIQKDNASQKTTTPLAANPPLRKSFGRLVGKKKFNFNYSSHRVKRRLEPIAVSTSSNSDDKDDTSNTSNDNLDEPVISQHNEEKNENTSSSDKSVSKSSSEDDVDTLSLSGQLASQVTAAPTISLIVPSTENLMDAHLTSLLLKQLPISFKILKFPQVS